jgi:hypothetical protein
VDRASAALQRCGPVNIGKRRCLGVELDTPSRHGHRFLAEFPAPHLNLRSSVRCGGVGYRARSDCWTGDWLGTLAPDEQVCPRSPRLTSSFSNRTADILGALDLTPSGGRRGRSARWRGCQQFDCEFVALVRSWPGSGPSERDLLVYDVQIDAEIAQHIPAQ